MLRKRITSQKLKLGFLFQGFVAGYFLNELTANFLESKGIFYLNIANIFWFIGIYSFFFWFCKKLFHFSLFTMFRLSLLGIAFASFLYALIDIVSFYNSELKFGTILGSLALGGLVSIFEKMLDLKEKNEPLINP